MAGDYHLDGIAVSETLTALQDLVDRLRAEHPELDSLDVSMVETAAVELVGNIVEHGLPPGHVTYALRLSVRPDRIECRLTDSGAAAVEVEPQASMPGTEAECGRGLAMAQAALDELRYERDGGRNVWTMVRWRRDDGAPGPEAGAARAPQRQAPPEG
jgi:serine/threonine-protein kinase RsbW